MRKSFPPTAKKPSPTATPFVPALPNDAIPSSSSEDAGLIGLSALSRVNLPPGKIACKFYVKGYCSRGSVCWFMHDAATVSLPMIVEEGGRKKAVELREPKGKGKAMCPKGPEAELVADSADSAEEGEPCAICFEVPITYGLLTNCDHVFCLGCIRSWRSSGNKSDNAASLLSPFGSPDDGNLNKTSKTCPLCRVRSKYIIPSSIFPTPPPGSRTQSSPDNDLSTNPAKQAIVQQYLNKLGTIPCRYFQDSMTRPGSCRGMRNMGRRRNDPLVPFCPFGNECHYAHTGNTGEKYAFSDRELSNHRRNRTRGGRNRTRWMEQMLLGVFGEAERNNRGPLFHTNAADAQAMLEILIESHAPGWAVGYDHFHDGEEDIDEDDLDGDEAYWQDEDDEPDAPGSEHMNVANMMNAMGFGSARQDFHGGVFESGQPHNGLRGDGPPTGNSPRAGGLRERREDGSLVVELDFFERGRNEVHPLTEAAFRARRGGGTRGLSADEDEMPRLVNVDDLD